MFSGISLRQVLEFSLGPISLSLTNTDGSIYKSVGSKLLKFLDTETVFDCIPFNTTVIYDGTRVIRKLPKGFSKFGTISEFVLERIARCRSREVIFVTDQYFERSIKGGEEIKEQALRK